MYTAVHVLQHRADPTDRIAKPSSSTSSTSLYLTKSYRCVPRVLCYSIPPDHNSLHRPSAAASSENLHRPSAASSATTAKLSGCCNWSQHWACGRGEVFGSWENLTKKSGGGGIWVPSSHVFDRAVWGWRVVVLLCSDCGESSHILLCLGMQLRAGDD